MKVTKAFKTQTNFIERKNPMVDNSWGIALDIGYSAVKGMSPNHVYSFPSFAKKINHQELNIGIGNENENSYELRYRDTSTGEIWAVGESAEKMLTEYDTKDNEDSLYGRNRYFSPMFLVIARVGMALGMLNNQYGTPKNKEIVIQTGLPPAYIKSDSVLLKEALSGTHDFDIKIKNGNWIHYRFVLNEDHIKIMAQPMGTLFSIAMDKNGNFVPDANKYFSSKLLVFDPGFGTLDIFEINGKAIESANTWDDLGMKRVFSETVNNIYTKYKKEIPVPFLQNCLEDGEFEQFDRKTRTSDYIEFDDILVKSNEKVCKEALERVDSIYNNLRNHNYLVITGGTGSAWEPIIRDYYKGIKRLEIIDGWQNDDLPDIFANVRGYYMFLYGTLNKKK